MSATSPPFSHSSSSPSSSSSSASTSAPSSFSPSSASATATTTPATAAVLGSPAAPMTSASSAVSGTAPTVVTTTTTTSSSADTSASSPSVSPPAAADADASSPSPPPPPAGSISAASTGDIHSQAPPQAQPSRRSRRSGRRRDRKGNANGADGSADAANAGSANSNGDASTKSHRKKETKSYASIVGGDQGISAAAAQDQGNYFEENQQQLDELHAKSNPKDRFAASRRYQFAAGTYKTEICSAHMRTGYCKYGDQCQFAHGVNELRPRHFDVKYKTQLCKNYHHDALCRFSSRCKFIHDEVRIQVSDSEFWLVSPTENLVRVEIVSNAARRDQLLELVKHPPPPAPHSDPISEARKRAVIESARMAAAARYGSLYASASPPTIAAPPMLAAAPPASAQYPTSSSSLPQAVGVPFSAPASYLMGAPYMPDPRAMAAYAPAAYYSMPPAAAAAAVHMGQQPLEHKLDVAQHYASPELLDPATAAAVEVQLMQQQHQHQQQQHPQQQQAMYPSTMPMYSGYPGYVVAPPAAGGPNGSMIV